MSAPVGSVPFCDLAAQQKRLKKSIDSRMQKVLEHGQYILGPEVAEFEEKLAHYVGAKHCITCANGTDAIMLVLRTLGIGPGDEVITTPFTFFATAEMILLVGAKPVFVDIDPKTYNIDPSLIEAKITSKTKAIMPVSLYGQCADMDTINAIARKHGIRVIEDAAQSFGAKYKGKASCAISDVATTSFFPSKPLGCYGDGGAIFTDNDDWAKTLRWMRAHGQDKRYHHPIVGVNSRLDTLQAAILLAKFETFEQEVEARAKIGARYTELLSHQSTIGTPYIEQGNTSVFAQYTIEVSQRERMQAHLTSKGIPTAIHYPLSLHQQPAVKPSVPAGERFPHAEAAASRVLSLPMSADLSEADQDRVIEAVLSGLS